MVSDAAICLLSGGLDSAVAMACVVNDGMIPYALLVDYGQRHAQELICAERVADYYHAKVFRASILLNPSFGSALTDSAIPVPNTPMEEIGRSVPPTYVPGRNLIFLSIAGGYAKSYGIHKIVVGFNILDYSGYPDCRPKFVDAMVDALELGIDDPSVNVLTPLIRCTKAEIIQMGLDLGAPLHLTRSCYNAGPRPCGYCDSCKLRAKGFAEVNIPDPA